MGPGWESTWEGTGIHFDYPPISDLSKEVPPSYQSTEASISTSAPLLPSPQDFLAEASNILEGELGLGLKETERQLGEWLGRQADAARLLGLTFNVSYLQPVREIIESLPSEIESAFSEFQEAAQIPYLRDLYRLQEDTKEALRRLNYDFAARGMVGSGPWVTSRERVVREAQRRIADLLYPYYRGTSRLEEALDTDALLRAAQAMREYQLRTEAAASRLRGWEEPLFRTLTALAPEAGRLGTSVLDTLRRGYFDALSSELARSAALRNMYGLPAMMSVLNELTQIGALPRQIAQSNINALIEDLFYRLGLGSRIAGGFGGPYATASEYIEETSPMNWLGRGLSAFGWGLVSDILRRGS